MKILIITLFAFVSNFVCLSVLAGDDSNSVCKTKNIGAFYYKSNGCGVEILTSIQQNINPNIKILKNTIQKLKDATQNETNLHIIEVLKNTIAEIQQQQWKLSKMQTKLLIETQPKKLSESNCKTKKGVFDCDSDQINKVIEACEVYPQICEIRNVVDLYKPNYAMVSLGNHNDKALEIQYSGRYNIKPISCVKNHNKNGLYIDYECVEDKKITEDKKGITEKKLPEELVETFFSLTGRYDFYVFGEDNRPMNNDYKSVNRESGQVVNRFFNPAFHTRLIYPKSDKLEFVDFSIEHLSNGQSGNFEEIDFSAGNDNYEASDNNSISMFFPSISAQLLLNNEKDDIKYKVFARAILDYWDAELDIYSEDRTEIGKNDFPGYHRFKIGVILESNSIDEITNIDEDEWLLELSLTGHRKTSFDAFLSYPVSRIPVVNLLDKIGLDHFLFRYHYGYLSRLSNYDLKEKTYGIGFGVAF